MGDGGKVEKEEGGQSRRWNEVWRGEHRRIPARVQCGGVQAIGLGNALRLHRGNVARTGTGLEHMPGPAHTLHEYCSREAAGSWFSCNGQSCLAPLAY